MAMTAPTSARPEVNTEERRVHTRLQQLALGVEEARAYWASIDPTVPPAPRAIQAFEQRWFGAKSLERVRTLLANLGARFDSFPESLQVLRSWAPMSPTTRQLICHWHLQLSDPLYRRFTAEFLVQRRWAATPTFDRPVVVRWVGSTNPGRWGSSTVIQFGSKLLSAASEAGLTTPSRDPREPLLPRVTDDALAYLLYLLRSVQFVGSVTANPYLESVGLDAETLPQRLRSLRDLEYRRLSDIETIEWAYPSLTAWAEATL